MTLFSTFLWSSSGQCLNACPESEIALDDLWLRFHQKVWAENRWSPSEEPPSMPIEIARRVHLCRWNWDLACKKCTKKKLREFYLKAHGRFSVVFLLSLWFLHFNTRRNICNSALIGFYFIFFLLFPSNKGIKINQFSISRASRRGKNFFDACFVYNVALFLFEKN